MNKANWYTKFFSYFTVCLQGCNVSFQESGVPVNDTKQEPFLELHYILEALKNHNLQPAL